MNSKKPGIVSHSLPAHGWHLVCLFLLDANLLFCFPVRLPFALLHCVQSPRDVVGHCLPLRPIRELGSATQGLWSMLKGSHHLM